MASVPEDRCAKGGAGEGMKGTAGHPEREDGIQDTEHRAGTSRRLLKVFHAHPATFCFLVCSRKG